MYRPLISILLLLSISSCISTKIKIAEKSYQEVSNIVYIDPILDIKNKTYVQSQHISKYTSSLNRRIDSLFTIPDNKFNINRKLLLRNKPGFDSIFLPKLNIIIEKLKSKNGTINTEDTQGIFDELRGDFQYLLVPVIKLRFIVSQLEYPDNIIISPPGALFYDANHNDLHLFILDLKNKEITLYGHASGDVQLRNTIQDLDNVFKKWQKK